MKKGELIFSLITLSVLIYPVYQAVDLSITSRRAIRRSAMRFEASRTAADSVLTVYHEDRELASPQSKLELQVRDTVIRGKAKTIFSKNAAKGSPNFQQKVSEFTQEELIKALRDEGIKQATIGKFAPKVFKSVAGRSFKGKIIFVATSTSVFGIMQVLKNLNVVGQISAALGVGLLILGGYIVVSKQKLLSG